jgi:drug/metabolite transporter (DMT)-like permease
LRVWLALWTVYLVWGSTYLAIRYLVETIPALLGSGLRFFTAGVLLAAFLVVRGGWAAMRVTRQELAGCAVIGCALLLGGNGLVAVSENLGTPSGLAALIIATVPLWVVAFRRATGEHVTLSTLLWVLAGFAGVALLLLPGDRPEGATIGGILILVAAAFSWASGSFASGRLLRVPSSPLRSNAWQMLAGGSAMVLVGLLAGEGGDVHPSQFSGRSIAAFVYLVVAGSLIAYTAYVWLLQNAPISQVATYAYVNPVVAIALGAVFVDEELTPVVLGAAVLVAASVAGTIRGQRAAARQPAVALDE